jgi:hypothetical protein
VKGARLPAGPYTFIRANNLAIAVRAWSRRVFLHQLKKKGPPGNRTRVTCSPLQMHYQTAISLLAKSSLSLKTWMDVPSGQGSPGVPEQSSVHGSFVVDADARILGLGDGQTSWCAWFVRVGCSSEVLIRFRNLALVHHYHGVLRSRFYPHQYRSNTLLLHIPHLSKYNSRRSPVVLPMFPQTGHIMTSRKVTITQSLLTGALHTYRIRAAQAQSGH